MLTKLVLTNYKSFSQKTTFDFKATNYEILNDTNQKDNILKGALLIGPNASGKSNALSAIRLLLLLMYGDREVDFNSEHCYFCRTTDMSLEYFFDIDNHSITYHIQHDSKSSILSETLTLDGDTVLNRIGSEGMLRLQTTINKSDLSNTKLFLRSLDLGDAFAGNEILKKFIDFLGNSYYFDTIITGKKVGKGLDSILKQYKETNYTNDLNEFFNKVNYGFNIQYSEELAGSSYKIKITDDAGKPMKEYFFIRNNFNTPVPLNNESLGNKIIFAIMPMLFLVAKNCGMLILDEFSSGLHNYLETLIIRYFMQNSNRSQLFFTSHSTNLISNYIMRPDQIFLVEFKSKDGSIIKRVSDFKPREAQNLEKMYLSGVFEGLPGYEKI